jgi:protein-disulfide isomerase
MRLKGALVSGLFAMILSAWIVTGVGSAQEPNTPFPSYGSGLIEVRLYTDYFCPPCRAMEPAVEPLLRDLLKRNVIRLTMVDVPFSQFTPLYAECFLSALKEKNDFEHALRVRNLLFAATADKNMTTKERIEALFKEKGISYSSWDAKPVYDRYNALIKKDKIDSTPTCIIIRDGKMGKWIGEPDIVTALKALQ